MSDLLNKLQSLIGKTSTEGTSSSGGTSGSSGTNAAGGSNNSYNEVSVFSQQSGSSVGSSATQMGDEEFLWWEERLEEKRQEELNAANGEESSVKSFDESKLDPKEWNSLEPKANNKLFSSEVKDYTFTTSGGTKIDLADVEGVKIYENSSTGEVIIVGANGATINASGKDANITIYDSDIKKLDTDQGNDEIKIYNSNVGEIRTGMGSDNILIENSEVNKIDTDSGNDNVFVSNGSVETLKTGNGEDILVLDETDAGNVKTGNDSDKVLANDSTVQKFDSAEGNDDLNVYDSTVGEITAGEGIDNVVSENSQVENINTGSGCDSVNIKNSLIGNANTSSEVLWGIFDDAEDTVTIVDSKANDIKTGKGDDNVIVSGSEVNELKTGKGENSVSIDDTDVTTLKTGKNDTVVEDKNYLDFDKTKLAELGADAVIQLGDGTTTTVAEYTQYLLSQPVGFETEEEYKDYVLQTLTANLETMKSVFGNQENEDGWVSDGYNVLKELTGLGISDKDIEEMIAKQEEMVNGLTAALNGESDMTFEEAYEYYTGTTYSKEKVDKYVEVANVYSAIMVGCQYDNDYIEEFEAATGMTVEDVTKEYALCQLDTFGKSTGLQELVEKYSQDQEGFTDKLSSIVSTVGLGCTVLGVAASFVFPPAAPFLLAAGKYVTLGGMFIDNALDLVNESTDANGLTWEEVGDIGLETAVETISYFVGRAIGTSTNNLNEKVIKDILGKGGSELVAKISAKIAEVGADAALSLTADYFIAQGQSFIQTGEFMPWDEYWSLDRFLGEGRSQLIGILTGVAQSKVSDYQKLAITTAQGKILAGDLEGARSYLKKSGMNFDDDGFTSFVKNVQEIDAQGLTPKQLGAGDELPRLEAGNDEPSTPKMTNGEEPNTEVTKKVEDAPTVEGTQNPKTEGNGYVYNPETGELTPRKLQSEAPEEKTNAIELDHPVSGDNTGVALRNVENDPATTKIDSDDDTGVKTATDGVDGGKTAFDVEIDQRIANGELKVSDTESVKELILESDNPVETLENLVGLQESLEKLGFDENSITQEISRTINMGMTSSQLGEYVDIVARFSSEEIDANLFSSELLVLLKEVDPQAFEGWAQDGAQLIKHYQVKNLNSDQTRSSVVENKINSLQESNPNIPEFNSETMGSFSSSTKELQGYIQKTIQNGDVIEYTDASGAVYRYLKDSTSSSGFVMTKTVTDAYGREITYSWIGTPNATQNTDLSAGAFPSNKMSGILIISSSDGISSIFPRNFGEFQKMKPRSN